MISIMMIIITSIITMPIISTNFTKMFYMVTKPHPKEKLRKRPLKENAELSR